MSNPEIEKGFIVERRWMVTAGRERRSFRRMADAIRWLGLAVRGCDTLVTIQGIQFPRTRKRMQKATAATGANQGGGK